MNVDYNKKVALVTGGGRNLGLVIVKSLINEGIHVCIFAKSKNYHLEILDEREKGNYSFFEVDVTNQKSVSDAIQSIIKKFGTVDVVVNNAGLKVFKSVMDIDYETWTHVIDVNLNGPFIVSKAIIPEMTKVNKGLIINIASKAGVHGYSTGCVYCSSKAALMRLTEAMAADVQGTGISICAICPSTIATQDLLVQEPYLNKSILLEPEYIAKVVLEIIKTPERFNGRCIVLTKPRIFLKMLFFLLSNYYHNLIDYYTFSK